MHHLPSETDGTDEDSHSLETLDTNGDLNHELTKISCLLEKDSLLFSSERQYALMSAAIIASDVERSSSITFKKTAHV
jgi:hypothetical protein